MPRKCTESLQPLSYVGFGPCWRMLILLAPPHSHDLRRCQILMARISEICVYIYIYIYIFCQRAYDQSPSVLRTISKHLKGFHFLTFKRAFGQQYLKLYNILQNIDIYNFSSKIVNVRRFVYFFNVKISSLVNYYTSVFLDFILVFHRF